MEEHPTFGFDFERLIRYCNNAISSDEEKLNYLKNMLQKYEDTYATHMRLSITETGRWKFKKFRVDMEHEIGIVIDRIGYESNSTKPVEEIKSDKIDNGMLETVNAEDEKKEKIEEVIVQVEEKVPEISESEITEKESIEEIKWLRKRGNKLLIYIIAKLMIEGFIEKRLAEDIDDLIFNHFRCLDGSRFNKKSLATSRKEMISHIKGMTVGKPPRGGDELEELIEHLKKIAPLLGDN